MQLKALLLLIIVSLLGCSVEARAGTLALETSGTCASAGVQSGGSHGSTTTSISTGITTCAPGDIVIAAIYAECSTTTGTVCAGGGATPPSFTGVSGGSLTWHHCGTTYSSANPCGAAADYTPGTEAVHTSRGAMSLWWAYASGIVSAQTITATSAANTDNAALLVFAVQGITNASNPFDTNNSLPAVNDNLTATGTDPTISGLSTTTNNTMFIGCAGNSQNTTTWTAGTGYTLIGLFNETAGTWFASVACLISTSQTSSPQSGASPNFNTGETGWLMWASAITNQAGGAVGAGDSGGLFLMLHRLGR